MDEDNLWFCGNECERIYHDFDKLLASIDVGGHHEVVVLRQGVCFGSGRGTLLVLVLYDMSSLVSAMRELC